MEIYTCSGIAESGSNRRTYREKAQLEYTRMWRPPVMQLWEMVNGDEEKVSNIPRVGHQVARPCTEHNVPRVEWSGGGVWPGGSLG